MTFPEIVTTLGKGPGYFLFAAGCAIGLFILAANHVDVSQLTGPLGVIAGGLYAGGAWKASAEARNGKSAGNGVHSGPDVPGSV